VTNKKEEEEDTELRLSLEKRSKLIEQQMYQIEKFKNQLQQLEPSQLPQHPDQ